MLEILFRGKCLKTNKWVYGDYSKFPPSCSSNTNYWIISNRKWFSIDVKTLGQYLGIRDKNSIKIFTGDIIPIWMKDNSSNTHEKVNGVVEFHLNIGWLR